MSRKVDKVLDPARVPPLNAAQKAEIAALLALPDTDIDDSDIPPLDEASWENIVRGKFYRPTKTSTTLRIDSDVLAWLRAQGKATGPESTLFYASKCCHRSNRMLLPCGARIAA